MDEPKKSQVEQWRECIFSGKEYNIHRHGVAIMMKKAEQALLEWKPISDRIIYARFFFKYVKLSIIQVYAPTNETNVEDKDNFYEQLQIVVDSFHKHDILLVMGDLNSQVGEDNKGYENIIGSHGVGERNDNGERLVDFCGLNNLVVTSTIFPHKLIHKQTDFSKRKDKEPNRPCVSEQATPDISNGQ